MSSFAGFDPMNKLYVFIFKKTLGKFLQSGTNLNTLDVSLLRGSVSLSSLFLDQQVS